jgi:hypothetical protein
MSLDGPNDGRLLNDDQVLELYRSTMFTTVQLRLLRLAFERDHRETNQKETRTFCEHRMRLIDRVLNERYGHEPLQTGGRDAAAIPE